MTPTVVVAEPLAPEGVAVLKNGGVNVCETFGESGASLSDALPRADALIVRSRTKVDAALLESAPLLRVVGRAGVGVDAIDVGAATRQGIVVLNTPDASTIATAEHTIAMLLASCRNIAPANRRIAERQWSNRGLMGWELAGKTLGIIGLGRIGAAVATRAKAFGMRVIAYDAFVSEARAEALGAKLVSFDELLTQSDIVTLHAPLVTETSGMLGANEFARMKSGARVVNCARGGLIVAADLLDALQSGHIAGAALDVFPSEPPDAETWKLAQHPAVLATPHLGGSTHEAQARIAADLCRDVLAVLRGQPPSAAVNAPFAAAPDARPFVELAYVLGKACPQFGRDRALTHFALTLEGELRGHDPRPFAAAFLVGLLPHVTARRVSAVNAGAVAAELGLAVETLEAPCERGFARAVAVRAGSMSLAGTVTHGHQLRLVEVDGYEVELAPQGHLIMTRHRDVPGIVGKAGTILGAAAINISNMQVSRDADRGEALMLLGVDRAAPPEVLAQLRGIGELSAVRSIEL